MDTEILKRTDVTAVLFYNSDVILIAVGGTVYMYLLSLESIIETKVIFVGQRIHGLILEKDLNNVVVFGGKELKIIEIENNTISKENELLNYSIQVLDKDSFKCNDWIQAVLWTNSYRSLAILTSHNFVQVLDIQTQHIKLYPPEEVCILYCGYLYNLHDSVLVFAGTVFSQVLLYSLHLRKTIHTLKGHKGVIFSIVWHEEHRIIVTTSDDRSVKICSVQSSTDLSPQTLEFWETACITCRCTMFGHTARVWRGLVTKDSIVSIGEDSKICVWSLSGALQKKIKTHQGGRIWSIDYCRELNRVITGGGDGSVILQPLTLLQIKDEQKYIISFEIDETPKKISLTRMGNIVCLTEKLNIIYHNVAEHKCYSVYRKDETDKFILMAASLDRCCFAFADLKGSVVLYRELETNLQYVAYFPTMENRILSLHFLDDERLITCGLSGRILVWNINMVSGQIQNSHDFTLPECKERWLTAVNAKSFGAYQCFIFGDRCSNLHIYGQDNKEPFQTLHKIHGRLGINSIVCVDNILVTMGRDGCLKYHNVTKNAITFIYSIKISFDWVEKLIKDENLICGFRESSLIMYDNVNHQEIFELNCGGGHRSWDIKSTSKRHLQLCYVKTGKVHIIKIIKDDITSKFILKGTHTKEINSMIMKRINNDNEMLLISGSEDTSLRISQYSDGSTGSFEELLMLRQLSSIRSISLENLHSDELDRFDYLLFTAGGRAEICVRMLQVFVKDKFYVTVKELCTYLMKGTDRQRKGNVNWRNVETDFDPETRFMSITTVLLAETPSTRNLNNSQVYLFAGCSDAYFRVYRLKNELDKFSLLNIATLKFHSKCLLQVKQFQLHDVIFILTMATDGIVAFWNGTDIIQSDDVDKAFVPISYFKIHKSGINDCDIYYIENNMIAIASGGDDNSINLNVFKIDHDELIKEISVERLASLSQDQWHCAQVTGVKFINNLKLLCASIDQRVSFLSWKYDTIDNSLQMDLIKQSFCDVPDIQGIDLCHHERESGIICAYGKGFSLLEYE